MIAREEHPDFGMLQVRLETGHFGSQFLNDIFSFGSKIEESPEIGKLCLEARIEFNILLQTAPVLQHGLSFFLIVPKVSLGDFLFNLLDLPYLSLYLKDNL
jgi:hypothetical protein